MRSNQEIYIKKKGTRLEDISFLFHILMKKKNREHILKSVMQEVHLCCFLLINITYLISMLKQTATRGHQPECGHPKKRRSFSG